LNWRQYPHPGGEDMLGRITAFAYGVACYVATLERNLLRIRARASAGPEEVTRKSDRRNIVAGRRTFFAGCKTYMDRPFFQVKNEAELFIDVLRTNTLAGKFKLHEFVVMPDHFHVLLTGESGLGKERGRVSVLLRVFQEKEKGQRLKPVPF
jgi:hypothetical protein